MSKIIVRRQEYANNGTHADEIEAVVQENLIVNTMSSATDVAPSAALLKSVSDSLAQGRMDKGTLQSTNLNNVTTVGVYSLSSSGTYENLPSNVSYGILEVLKPSTGSSFVAQIVINESAVSNRCCIRVSANGGTTWTMWYRFIYTEETEPYITYRVYTQQYTVAANSSVGLSAENFSPQIGTPSGRLLMGIRTFNTGSVHVVPVVLQHGSTGNIITLRNVSSSSVTATMTIAFNYIQGDAANIGPYSS